MTSTVDWIDFKSHIHNPELINICDLALKTEHSVELVEKGIKRSNVRSDYFIEMRTNLYRLITEIMNIARKYNEIMKRIGSKNEKEKLDEVEKLTKDLTGILELQEAENREIRKELAGSIVEGFRVYPQISLYVSEVRRVLNVYLRDVLIDVISYRNQIDMIEFLVSLIRRKGITLSPETMRIYKETKEKLV